jgi:hypothetical protein
MLNSMNKCLHILEQFYLQNEQIIEFYEQIDLQIEQEGYICEQIILCIEMHPHVEPN